jgi:hypothetical protein
MRLRLKLTATDAHGLMAGYDDLAQFWEIYRGNTGGLYKGYGASGPTVFKALHELADGYKDPHTGRCTAISSAEKFEFVRAYLVHPSVAPSRQLASVQDKTAP